MAEYEFTWGGDDGGAIRIGGDDDAAPPVSAPPTIRPVTDWRAVVATATPFLLIGGAAVAVFLAFK